MRRIMGATRTLAQTSQSVQMPSNKVCSHRYLLWARRPFFCVGRRAGAHPDRPVAARVQTLSPALAVSLCRRASGPTAGGLRHLLTGAAVACARPHRPWPTADGRLQRAPRSARCGARPNTYSRAGSRCAFGDSEGNTPACTVIAALDEQIADLDHQKRQVEVLREQKVEQLRALTGVRSLAPTDGITACVHAQLS